MFFSLLFNLLILLFTVSGCCDSQDNNDSKVKKGSDNKKKPISKQPESKKSKKSVKTTSKIAVATSTNQKHSSGSTSQNYSAKLSPTQSVSISQPSMQATQKNTPIPRTETPQFTPAANAFSEASMKAQSTQYSLGSAVTTMETQDAEQ